MTVPQERVAPSTAAIAIASAIIAGVFGYFLGQFSTLGKVTNSYSGSSGKAKYSDSESDEDDDQPLSNFSGSAEECKLVLVVRTDLGMTKGKSSKLEHCDFSF